MGLTLRQRIDAIPSLDPHVKGDGYIEWDQFTERDHPFTSGDYLRREDVLAALPDEVPAPHEGCVAVWLTPEDIEKWLSLPSPRTGPVDARVLKAFRHAVRS